MSTLPSSTLHSDYIYLHYCLDLENLDKVVLLLSGIFPISFKHITHKCISHSIKTFVVHIDAMRGKTSKN